MRKIGLFIILCQIGILASLQAANAQDPLQYLRKQCPQLTEKYQDELNNCHAHYVFAVDVSRSMAKFEENVLPALKSFVTALPVGDKVTLIPFAQSANDNKIGFDVDITSETRQTLVQMLPSLYPKGVEIKDKQYQDTDICEAQLAITRSIQQNAQFEVNIIVFISDMMHCPANNIDRPFNNSEISSMESLLKSSKSDAEIRLFALKLPPSGKPEGFVLPSLDELYMNNWGQKIISVDVPANSAEAIGQWFDKQKDRIMFTKLQAVIFKENRANPIVVETDVDIDGNVTANIQWTATKLYPKITLDSTYMHQGSDFKIKCNRKYVGYSAVGEMNEEEIELGQIKHSELFFHNMNDTLHFDVSLPVPYQNEINRLMEGRPGPLANATELKKGLVWTFFLPLWMSVLIAVCILLYILLVFRAIGRNAKYSYSGKVTVIDIETDEDICKRTLNNIKGSFSIGKAAGNGLSCPVDWSVDVKKVTPSALAFWKKPYYQWKQGVGYVSMSGKARNSGKLSGITSLTCSAKRGEQMTHKVKIEQFKSK